MKREHEIALQLGLPFFSSGMCFGFVIDYLLNGRYWFALLFILLGLWNARLAVRGLLRWHTDQREGVLEMLRQMGVNTEE